VAGEIAALTCATSPGEKARHPPAGRSSRAAVRFPCPARPPAIGGAQTACSGSSSGRSFSPASSAAKAARPLLEPERLNPDLPRDGLDRLAPQQPQDDIAFWCRAPALHRLARDRFHGRRHHDPVVSVVSSDSHMGNPVSKFIDGRSGRARGALRSPVDPGLSVVFRNCERALQYQDLLRFALRKTA